MLKGINTKKKSFEDLPKDRPIAYFCAEYGITDNLPIYSGGLGVLAGDIVQEASERNLPFIPIGLFYQRGYFHQMADTAGQKEYYKETIPSQVPLELIKDTKTKDTLLIEVPIADRVVFVQVWKFALPNDHALYLLDTDHWKNNENDRQITDQLYGGDQQHRICQELVLAIGGARLLKFLKVEPSVYHMNEGHSAFLGIELAREKMLADQVDFNTALAKVREQIIFTNHTLVPAGNDMFPHDLIRNYLGKYLYDAKINPDDVLAMGQNNDKPDHFAMTMSAMRSASMSNAVSRLHAQKARDIWPDYRLLPITNGVHLPMWVTPELQQIWDEHMPNWRTQTDDIKVWKKLRNLPAPILWQVHREMKGRLLDEVYAREGIRLDEDTLTVVWARRFATYKRPDMLFADLERLKQLVFNEERPIQIIVAGKSHPADEQGKQIIGHIEYLSNYQLKRRAVFIDDYSISLAKYLVAGADVWLNTPVFGLEASGTSGMKASANGVIQFTVPDGWAYEVDWYGLGYTLPIHKAESEIYNLFEKKICPSYYRRNANGIPELWVSMMRETIINISPYFSSARMVKEYVEKMYHPCIDKQGK